MPDPVILAPIAASSGATIQPPYSVVSPTEPKLNRGPLRVLPFPAMPNHYLEITRDNQAGLIFVRVTHDNGKTWHTIYSEPPQGTAVGAIPMLDANGNVTWVALSKLDAVLDAVATSAKKSNRSHVDSVFFGDFVVGRVFGRFQVPSDSNLQCLGMEIIAQDPPTGAEVRVDIVNASGTIQTGTTGHLAVNALDQATLFTTPLTMSASSVWRLRINQIGATLPGGNAVIRLQLKAI